VENVHSTGKSSQFPSLLTLVRLLEDPDRFLLGYMGIDNGSDLEILHYVSLLVKDFNACNL